MKINTESAGSKPWTSVQVTLEQAPPPPPPRGTVTITMSVPVARILERVIGTRVNGSAFSGLYWALNSAFAESGFLPGSLPSLPLSDLGVVDIRDMEKAVGL